MKDLLIIGVGGTMAKYANLGHDVVVCEVTAGDLQDEMVQRQKKEVLNSHRIIGVKETIFMDLPVVGLREMTTREINTAFLDKIRKIRPDIVFIPNIYSDISEVINKKIDAMKCHSSQLCNYPHPRSIEAIEALAKHRGSTVCCKYAEAFMCVRQVL